MDEIVKGREYLKSDRWGEWEANPTDQRRGVPRPPLEKPCSGSALTIPLPGQERFPIIEMSVLEATQRRRSRRRYSDAALTLPELAYLLWMTQGVHEVFREGVSTRRTVPSAGARHPFETYLAVSRVEGLTPGLYRYLPLEHHLCPLATGQDLAAALALACHDQAFIAKAAVTFVWSAVPYRMEWRYTFISPKLIALDAGHVCQNLYLACESIGAGTCAVGAYHQDRVDAILGLDGQDEFAVYVAPVGKLEEGPGA